jgi:predicted translin family RNA/ssDNA-binding protein
MSVVNPSSVSIRSKEELAAWSSVIEEALAHRRNGATAEEVQRLARILQRLSIAATDAMHHAGLEGTTSSNQDAFSRALTALSNE